MYKLYDVVKLKNSDIKGIIKKVNFKKGKYFYNIEINNKTVFAHEDNIEYYNENESIENKDSFPKPTVNIYIKKKNNEANSEIMLRHKTLDIALFELENFIEESILNNILNIRIIHGKNGGILRKGVHDYLKKSNKVIEFRLGGYTEGQYGVTIVKLKGRNND